MKKNVYLWIIGIVTALCIICGLGYHTLAMWRGADVVEKKVALEAFDSVSIEAEAMEVNVIAGTGYELQYCCSERYAPNYEIKDGVLVIEQSQKGQGWKPWNEAVDRREMTLTVPADAALNELTIVSDVGEIEIDGISFDKGEIESDVGEIWLGSCEFRYLEIESDVGEVEAVLTGAESDYTLNLISDIGEIEINESEFGNHYSVRGNTEKEISITTDIGEIGLSFEK